MNVFLKAACVVFLVFACWVEGHANSMMDRVEQCNRIAAGASARMAGFQGKTEWVSREQFKQYSEQHYTGGMYIRDDGENAEERAKYDEPMMFGWNMQDAYIKKHGGTPQHPKEILEACMKQQDSLAKPGFTNVSQSENLTPRHVLRLICQHNKEALELIAGWKSTATTEQEFFHANPAHDDWSQEMRDYTYQIMHEMWVFPGESAVFIAAYYDRCMVSK